MLGFTIQPVDQEIFQSLDDWAKQGELGEDRETAKNKIWDAYQNQSESLYLYDLGLTSIPDCIGRMTNLKKLSLAGNNLTSLPESIGDLKNLKKLFLNENHLTSLPENIGNLKNLEQFDISQNQLANLSENIGGLTNLWHLELTDNNLISLPESIGGLTNLTMFHLANNNLTSLPESILNLPHFCLIEFDASHLSDQVLNRLMEIVNTPGYDGPRIQFMMEFIHSDRSVASLEELLGDLCKIAEISVEDLDFIKGLSDSQTTALRSWLSRLSLSAGIFRGGKTQKEFAQKVLSFLQQANVDEKFRDIFLAVVHDAHTTCGDRMILSVLDIGIAYRLATIDLSDLKAVAEFLKKGPGAKDILEGIAREKVETLAFVDPIEVYLAYPVQLKKELDLQIDIDQMLYFKVSGVTQQDLESAKERVQSFYEDENQYLTFLVNHEKWIEVLQEHVPEEVEVINEKRLKSLEEDPDGYEAAQEEYLKALKELTKEVLGVNEDLVTSPHLKNWEIVAYLTSSAALGGVLGYGAYYVGSYLGYV